MRHGARAAGKNRISCYAGTGFSRLTVGDPSGAQGLELDTIAAVAIGGGSLAGGQGSVLASLIGALIMQVLQSGCAQMGWPNWVYRLL